MILLAEAQVKIFAPKFSEVGQVKIWRRNRTDEQLKTLFQQYVLDRYNFVIHRRYIQISGDYQYAA